MNQRRYRDGAKKGEKGSAGGRSEFLRYLKSMIEGIEGREMSWEEIEALREHWLEKGRQQGLLKNENPGQEPDG